MNKTGLPVLIIFLLLTACGAATKKSDQEMKLKKGEELFAKYGCFVCHSLEGKVIYGPPLNGLYMKSVKVMRNGKEIDLVADRDYLIKAITDPRYEKVYDYRNKEMPISAFPEKDAEVLVEYLISLNDK